MDCAPLSYCVDVGYCIKKGLDHTNVMFLFYVNPINFNVPNRFPIYWGKGKFQSKKRLGWA